MSFCRMTMLFHHVSGTTSIVDGPPVITSGFSESWLIPESVVGSVQVNRMMQRRAALLPQNAGIIGQRFAFNSGRTISATVRFAGTAGLSPDVPQMSALVKSFSAARQSTRRFAIKGIPDAWVIGGILQLTPGILTAFRNYFQACFEAQANWRCIDVLAPTVGIVSIDTLGNLRTDADWTPLAGNKVVLVRAFDDQGNAVAARTRILTRTDARNFQLANWIYPNVVNQGSIRLVQLTETHLVPVDTEVVRQATFKVGRPFFAYRGKRSKRKNTRRPAPPVVTP